MIFPPLLRDSSGNIIPQIWDGANWQPYKGQVEGLEALALLIEGLSQTDYATDAKLEAVRGLVEAISQKGFATETTLAQALEKQDTAKLVLDAISSAVAAAATEQTLTEIRAALTDGTQQVQLTGNKVKIQIDTLVNAASVAAGGKVTADLGAQGESELMLLVSTDKQPWRVVAGHPWYPNGDALGVSTTIYPSADRTTTHTVANPASLLYLGRVLTGVTVESFAEAIRMQIPPAAGVTMRFSNLSAETATVTIKALRIWR